MGEIYYDLGFLATPEVIECTASDLIGEFVGHTAPKTKTLLERSLGKVLFVDEAYRLLESGYAHEAVNELISLLPSAKYHKKMVIILAAYHQDMGMLLLKYPALSQLFPKTIDFRDLTDHECMKILESSLKGRNVDVPFLENTEERKGIQRLMKVLKSFPWWSNAREIYELAGRMFDMALDGPDDQTAKVTFEDAKKCIIGRIKEHHSRMSETGRVNMPWTLPGISDDQTRTKEQKYATATAEATSSCPIQACETATSSGIASPLGTADKICQKMETERGRQDSQPQQQQELANRQKEEPSIKAKGKRPADSNPIVHDSSRKLITANEVGVSPMGSSADEGLSEERVELTAPVIELPSLAQDIHDNTVLEANETQNVSFTHPKLPLQKLILCLGYTSCRGSSL